VTLRRGTVLIAAEERRELNYYSNGDTLTRGGLVGSIPEWLLHGNLAATTIWLQVAVNRLITGASQNDPHPPLAIFWSSDRCTL